MNQDFRFGEGFDKVHPSTLIDSKLMYALTRYPDYESYCFHTWRSAYCHLKYNIGSLDAYLLTRRNVPLYFPRWTRDVTIVRESSPREIKAPFPR